MSNLSSLINLWLWSYSESHSLFALLLWAGGPGECADLARRRGAAGKPEEDHNTVHDQIWEGQSAGDTGSADSVSVVICVNLHTGHYFITSALHTLIAWSFPSVWMTLSQIE